MQSKGRKPPAPDPRKKLSPAEKERALKEDHKPVEQEKFEEVIRRLVTGPSTRVRE